MGQSASCILPLPSESSPKHPLAAHVVIELAGGGELAALGSLLLAGSAHAARQRKLCLAACGCLPLMDPDGAPDWALAFDWLFEEERYRPEPGSPFHGVPALKIKDWVAALASQDEGSLRPEFASLLEQIPIGDRIGSPANLGFGHRSARLVGDLNPLAMQSLPGGCPIEPEAIPTLVGEEAARILANPSVELDLGGSSPIAYRHAQGRWLAFCLPDGPRNLLGRLGLAEGAWMPLSQMMARRGGPSWDRLHGKLGRYLSAKPTSEDQEDLLALWRIAPPQDFWSGRPEPLSAIENWDLLSLVDSAPSARRACL